MQREIFSGFILKDRIIYNEKGISFVHSHFQFPFSFSSFKWIGFVKEEEHGFDFDKKVNYFLNQGKILKRKTIYLSLSGEYDTLPNSEEDMANDDQDDLTLEKYSNREVAKTSAIITSDLDEDYDADLYQKTETIQLRIGKYIPELYDILEKSTAIRAIYHKVGKVKSLNQQCLAYTDTWAYHVKPRLFNDSEIDTTPIKYMAFFLKTKPFFSKGGLYCGYHRQIFINKASASIRDEFFQWCKARAPRLTEKGDSFTSSVLANPFNIWRWFYPDYISLTEKAVLYTRRTLRMDEMTYLPYSRVNFLLSHRGIFFKSFDIYGEQNILPKFSFSKSDYLQIKEIINSKGVKNSFGRVYHSTFLYPKNWFGRAPRLILVGQQLIYYPNRLKRKIEEYKEDQQHTALNLNDLYDVTWYKTLFTWIGDIKIIGVPSNIRKDQNNKYATIVIPNLWMFKYRFFFFFKGSLRKYLGSNSSITFKREFLRSWKGKEKTKDKENHLFKWLKTIVKN